MNPFSPFKGHRCQFHRWSWHRVYLRCERCGEFRRREGKGRVQQTEAR